MLVRALIKRRLSDTRSEVKYQIRQGGSDGYQFGLLAKYYNYSSLFINLDFFLLYLFSSTILLDLSTS